MTTWYKFPCDYWTQPRMFKLRRQLKIDALWVPARIWSFAATQDGTGNLSDYEPAELAEAIGYDGDADKMVAALKDAGYIDHRGMIIGWIELYALAASRANSAKKAANARWSRPHSDPEKPREDERTERDAHALRDEMRDAHQPTHHASAFSLDEGDYQTIAGEFGVGVDGIKHAEQVFRENKANFPADPQSREAFKGWLRVSRDGKALLKRYAPKARRYPEEPRKWRQWLNATCPDSAYAHGRAQENTEWADLESSARDFIIKGMAKEGLVESERPSSGTV